MNNENAGSLQRIIKPVIRFVIALVIILIIRAIVSSLPMVKDARFGNFPLTPLQIARMVIDTIIIALILKFGSDIGRSLRPIVKRFPEAGTVVNIIIILIAISVAYGAYKSLSYLLPRSLQWAYSVLFIVLVFFPLYRLVMTVYRNIDKLTDATVKQIEIATKSYEFCSNCGSKLDSNKQFCPSCGQAVKKDDESSINAMKCPKCNADVESGAKFCGECGAEIEVKEV